MRRALVEIVNIHKEYPLTSSLLDRFAGSAKTIKALNGVDLSIYRGETLGLVGESGCGKSTLGRIVLGLEKPTQGLVKFDGKLIDNLQERSEIKELRKKMQMVFQNPSSTLNPRMRLYEILSEPLEIHYRLTRKEMNKKIEGLLEMVGLHYTDIGKYPGEFSDGQKQRIALARALSLNPEFVVADEPVSSLDVSVQAQILNLMKRLQQEMHLTILFISHDLKVVRFLSDRIAVIYLGKIVELAPSRELFRTPYHPYSKELISSILDVDPSLATTRFRSKADVFISQLSPPKGCIFHPKCPAITQICETASPELKEVTQGHFVACFRAQEE